MSNIRARFPTFSQGLVTLQWLPFGHTVCKNALSYAKLQSCFGTKLILTAPGERVVHKSVHFLPFSSQAQCVSGCDL